MYDGPATANWKLVPAMVSAPNSTPCAFVETSPPAMACPTGSLRTFKETSPGVAEITM